MPQGHDIESMTVVKRQYQAALKQIGSLGGGNHFIELQRDENEYLWVIFYSGSRNLGKQVCDYYNEKAGELNHRWHSAVDPAMMLSFLPLHAPEFDRYWAEMQYCTEFALANRHLMMEWIKEVISDVFPDTRFERMTNIAHNYTEINVISNYAACAPLTVTVTDAAGSLVEGATVEFKLYNYAEFYTVSRKTSDARGQASLSAGLGAMLVTAVRDGRFGVRKVSFGREPQATVVLDHCVGDEFSFPIDIVPPAENANLPEVTAAQRTENDLRFNRKDSIRSAYIATFPAKSDAATGAETSVLTTARRGYFVVGLLGVGQEPTDHALKDIAAKATELEKWGRSLILLFPDERAYRKYTASPAARLPETVTFGIDRDGSVRRRILEAMQLPGNVPLPVFLIGDTFNRVVFESHGYTIGLGDRLLHTIHQL